MSEKILILGGTREAADLAARLTTAGHDVTTSLAGRTRAPTPLVGTVRSGGFGGADGLAQFLIEHGFDRLIDATHPFAERISANAAKAVELAGIAFENRVRRPWHRKPGDEWTEFPSLEAARDALPRDARVLLAIGSQHVAIFASRPDVHFVVRMVDPPLDRLPLADHELVVGKPGPTIEEELELLRERRITRVLCRNSGGPGAYAKVEAARILGLPVMMIVRPA